MDPIAIGLGTLAVGAGIVGLVLWIARTSAASRARRGGADGCLACGEPVVVGPDGVTTCPACGYEGGEGVRQRDHARLVASIEALSPSGRAERFATALSDASAALEAADGDLAAASEIRGMLGSESGTERQALIARAEGSTLGGVGRLLEAIGHLEVGQIACGHGTERRDDLRALLDAPGSGRSTWEGDLGRALKALEPVRAWWMELAGSEGPARPAGPPAEGEPYAGGIDAALANEVWVRGMAAWTFVFAEQAIPSGQWDPEAAAGAFAAAIERARTVDWTHEDLATRMFRVVDSGRRISQHDYGSNLFRIEALACIGWALGHHELPTDPGVRSDGDALLHAFLERPLAAFAEPVRLRDEADVRAMADRYTALRHETEAALVGHTDEADLQLRRSRALERSRGLNWLLGPPMALDRAQPSDPGELPPEPAPVLPSTAAGWVDRAVADALIAEAMCDVVDISLPGDDPPRARGLLQELKPALDLAQSTVIRRSLTSKSDVAPHVGRLFGVPALAWAVGLTDDLTDGLELPFSWMPESAEGLAALRERASLRSSDALRARLAGLDARIDALMEDEDGFPDPDEAAVYGEASPSVLVWYQRAALRELVDALPSDA